MIVCRFGDGTNFCSEVGFNGSISWAQRVYRLACRDYSLLALGYAGYYFCRSNLSVVLPELIHDLAQHGTTPSEAQMRLGFIASVGTILYAGGKFISGSMADLFGGRRNFLAGMAGSVFFTILFALGGGFPLFTLAWIGNRVHRRGSAGQGRVAVVLYSTGTIVVVLSLSFFLGMPLPVGDELLDGPGSRLARVFSSRPVRWQRCRWPTSAIGDPRSAACLRRR
jgi:hypothetical protein